LRPQSPFHSLWGITAFFVFLRGDGEVSSVERLNLFPSCSITGILTSSSLMQRRTKVRYWSSGIQHHPRCPQPLFFPPSVACKVVYGVTRRLSFQPRSLKCPKLKIPHPFSFPTPQTHPLCPAEDRHRVSPVFHMLISRP